MAQSGGAQVVGNIGMYYAAYRLSQQGWNVTPTASNARSLDLLAYDAGAHVYNGIQVNAGTKTPICFIMKPKEVKQLCHRGEKEGRVSYWLQPNLYDTDQFREAWDRIGRGDSSRRNRLAGAQS